MRLTLENIIQLFLPIYNFIVLFQEIEWEIIFIFDEGFIYLSTYAQLEFIHAATRACNGTIHFTKHTTPKRPSAVLIFKSISLY